MKQNQRPAGHNVQGISSDEFDEALRQAYEKYGDILSRPHPVSKIHPPMARGDRAAQFAPFAALAGFEEAIRHAQKEYEKQMGGEGGKAADDESKQRREH